MKIKEKKLIVTFHTTTDAISFEDIFKRLKISGRLIPVPRVLSAGCGMAWLGNIVDRYQTEITIIHQQLEIFEIHEMDY